ncbi:MAG: toprim domain-containing protein [Nitrospinae bacterium]|nr:toprim domain-containing protein [Nitrospinota bacterium]
MIAEIKHHAAGRWLEILPSLAPQLSMACERPGRHVPCPVHGGVDGFRLFADSPQTGGGICNSCGGFPDGLHILQWANGWTFREALKAVSSHLDLLVSAAPGPKPTLQPKTLKNWDLERRRLESIWGATCSDNGRIAQYLESRGLNPVVPPGLRLHPSLVYYHKGPPVKYPTMIARIQRDGGMVGLHFTYLDIDGPGKAPVSQPRKIRKCVENIAGGTIRLFEPVNKMPLALAEGIESALAVRDITGFPVWACGSTSLLSKVKIPESAHKIYIAADRDRSGAGKRAAEALAQRLWDESRCVATISLPPLDIPEGQKSVDWNDYVAQPQEAACE